MFALTLLYSLSFGIAAALQGPTNAALGRHVGSMQATLVSFTGGLLGMLVLNTIVTVVTGESTFSGVFDCEPWMLLGGLYGAYAVFCVAYAVQRLGVALTLTLQVLSGVLVSFAVDSFGWLNVEVIPIEPLRLVGCVLLFVGILLVYKGRLVQAQQGGQQLGEKKSLVAVALIVSSGIAVGVMPATNVALRSHVSLFEAGTIHFAIGVAALLILTLVAGKGKLKSLKGIPLWKLTGGLYGVYGIPALIITTPILGVGLNTATNQLGQLLGAVVVDTFGLLATPKERINTWRAVGIVVLFLGILVVALPRIM